MSSSSWGSWQSDRPVCDGNGAHCFTSGQIRETMCQVCQWQGYPVKTTQTTKYCVPCLIIKAKDSGCPVHNARGSAVHNLVEPNGVEITGAKPKVQPTK